jgi:CHAD domain-containing protein
VNGARHGMERLLRRLLAVAIEAADDGARPLGTRVHEMRTAIKKARALLRLVDPLLGRRGRRERTNLAAVARWVGSVRDAGVVVETFDRLMTTGPTRATSISALRGRLTARRREVEESRTTIRNLRRAGHALRLARRRAKGLLLRGDGRRALADGFARGYRAARLAMKEAARRDTPEAFHAWRKAVKTHAFQVRVLAGAGVGELRDRVAVLDVLGATLGEAHDLGLLAEIVFAESAVLSGKRSRYGRLVVRAEIRRRDLHARALSLGHRPFEGRPRDLRRIVLESRSLKGLGDGTAL